MMINLSTNNFNYTPFIFIRLTFEVYLSINISFKILYVLIISFLQKIPIFILQLEMFLFQCWFKLADMILVSIMLVSNYLLQTI
jgi:hypothetical protein